MPNKKSKKKNRERLCQKEANPEANPTPVDEDNPELSPSNSSPEKFLTAESKDKNIDEILENEDIEDWVSEPDQDITPNEEKKLADYSSGYDDEFVKRVDISLEKKKQYNDSLIHKDKDVFERLSKAQK